MTADLGERIVLQRALHRRLHATRRADADRVGDAAMLDADRLQQHDDALDLVGRHLALVGAAERARHRGADADAGRPGRGDDRAEALDAFLDAAVDVALAEGLARRAEDDDLVGLARQRRLETP